MPQKVSSIDYVCTWCGKHDLRPANYGRPVPGICPRKPKSREDDFCSLTEEQIAYYCALYQNPEIFLWNGSQIIVMQVV